VLCIFPVLDPPGGGRGVLLPREGVPLGKRRKHHAGRTFRIYIPKVPEKRNPGRGEGRVPPWGSGWFEKFNFPYVVWTLGQGPRKNQPAWVPANQK